jgi:hypothetical protein
VVPAPFSLWISQLVVFRIIPPSFTARGIESMLGNTVNNVNTLNLIKCSVCCSYDPGTTQAGAQPTGSMVLTETKRQLLSMLICYSHISYARTLFLTFVKSSEGPLRHLMGCPPVRTESYGHISGPFRTFGHCSTSYIHWLCKNRLGVSCGAAK